LSPAISHAAKPLVSRGGAEPAAGDEARREKAAGDEVLHLKLFLIWYCAHFFRATPKFEHRQYPQLFILADKIREWHCPNKFGSQLIEDKQINANLIASK